MYAMQYEITLPADYDMGIIRHRVATRGALLDDFAGLGLKAYCIRERGTHGSPVNEYAPFYLWHSIDGMNRFLWGGGGFQGIVADFGRPSVRTWTGAGFALGDTPTTETRTAVRHTEPLPPGIAPDTVVDEAVAELHKRAAAPGVVATAFGINPSSWELVHITLSAEDDPATDDPTDIRYQVGHVCSPDLANLPTGQHW
jgi:hypothetical protein